MCPHLGGERTVPISGSEYVLQNFTQEELNELKNFFHVSTSLKPV